MSIIRINQDVCIRCGKCVTVCPSQLFKVENGVMCCVGNECIDCGHCVAVCPQGAIEHEKFPQTKLHPLDRKAMPDSDSLMYLIKGRRSNRVFSLKSIPDDYLKKIMEAANYAPTATNARDVHMLLITDKKIIAQMSDITMKRYISVLSLLKNPILKFVLKRIMPDNYKYIPTFERLKEAHEAGNDQILHGATAIILFYTSKKSRFGCQDANLAYQNASLMAESLGVAHFYTGFVCSASYMDRNNTLQKLLGIDGTIHAGMALGMPRFLFSKWIER